jgi:hypothetical protein
VTSADSGKPLSSEYSVIIPDETIASAAAYADALMTGACRPGKYLQRELHRAGLASLTARDLLGLLCDTKLPHIFAESAVAGDGSDWTLAELQLLGDIAIAVPVSIFDNGNHREPAVHAVPFAGMLLYTPGALLRNGRGQIPADWTEVTYEDGRFSSDGYYELYRRRLLPVLQFVNEHAAIARSALVTVPGLGCGQFAGPFQGQLGERLQTVIERLLSEHGAELPNIAAIYFDPYNECTNARNIISGIKFLVRPLTARGNEAKSQLCSPSAYAEEPGEFSHCALYSVVAWDHVSWPGNDFFAGSRATDDGVKAAATSSMSAITGMEGHYDATAGKYQPPVRYRCWAAVVEEGRATRGLRLWNEGRVWSREAR